MLHCACVSSARGWEHGSPVGLRPRRPPVLTSLDRGLAVRLFPIQKLWLPRTLKDQHLPCRRKHEEGAEGCANFWREITAWQLISTDFFRNLRREWTGCPDFCLSYTHPHTMTLRSKASAAQLENLGFVSSIDVGTPSIL